MRPDRIPLFPLNVVLLPGAPIPLHIFEPRYRQMVGNCVDCKTEFGMLLALPDGIARVGCTAEVTKIEKRYPDGRMDILAEGRAPFRVIEFFDDNPLLEAIVDYLEDRERAQDDKILRELVELYEACHTLVFGDYPKDSGEPGVFSFVVASKLPMELLWKQQILELRSEADRQERLLTYLREWAAHLQKAETKRKHAAGNGHSFN